MKHIKLLSMAILAACAEHLIIKGDYNVKYALYMGGKGGDKDTFNAMQQQ